MPKDRPDFITVRISDHALQLLGTDAAVAVNGGRMNYQFRGNNPVEILRTPEWIALQHDQFDGEPLFQAVTAEPAAAQITDTAHAVSDTAHEG